LIEISIRDTARLEAIDPLVVLPIGMEKLGGEKRYPVASIFMLLKASTLWQRAEWLD